MFHLFNFYFCSLSSFNRQLGMSSTNKCLNKMSKCATNIHTQLQNSFLHTSLVQFIIVNLLLTCKCMLLMVMLSASSLSGIQLANIMSFFIASISWRSPWSVTFFADLAIKRCVQSKLMYMLLCTHMYIMSVRDHIIS